MKHVKAKITLAKEKQRRFTNINRGDVIYGVK
jgi:hypothetical protein